MSVCCCVVDEIDDTLMRHLRIVSSATDIIGRPTLLTTTTGSLRMDSCDTRMKVKEMQLLLQCMVGTINTQSHPMVRLPHRKQNDR